MSTATEIAVLLALVLVNGLLAGAEIAVVTVRASRIDELVENGRRGARALKRLRERPERFFATVQTGITVFGVTAGAFGGARFGDDLAQVLARSELLAPYAGPVAYTLVVALVTYLSLILGELVPKSLALRASEPYSLIVARPLTALEKALTPAVWLLTASSNAVLRLFGDRTDFLETRVSLDEIRSMVDEAREGGSLDPGAGLIASRALDLSELTAYDVMVHRRYVRALPIDADETALRKELVESGHRRLPVYDGSIDNVVGYISWRDVVERVWSGKSAVPRELVRDVRPVPEAAPAAPLLREMLHSREHLVVVVDEHGGLAGIVTLEDILEELVGEIESEHATSAHRFQRLPDGSTRLRGDLTLRDVDRELGTSLERDSDAHTVSGLVVQLAGDRIPRAGEVFETAGGARLEIHDASPRRVRLVAVLPRARVGDSDGAAE